MEPRRRRESLIQDAARAALAALGTGAGGARAEAGPTVVWSRDVCTFCGGGVLVGTDEARRVVAVRGDPCCPASRGMLCAKSYRLPLVPSGALAPPADTASERWGPVGARC